MQHFSSYGRALFVVVIERVAKVLGCVLVVCGLLWFLYVRQLGEGGGGGASSGVGEIFVGDRVSLGAGCLRRWLGVAVLRWRMLLH